MKKNLFMLFAVILTACVFASCSKDDDDNSGAASSLTMNGEAIKVKSIEGVGSCKVKRGCHQRTVH